MLDLNSEISYCGQKYKVAGIRFDGERYYFLVDKHGDVAFIPASAINSELDP